MRCEVELMTRRPAPRPFCQRLVSLLRYLFSSAVATHMVWMHTTAGMGNGRLQRALQEP